MANQGDKQDEVNKTELSGKDLALAISKLLATAVPEVVEKLEVVGKGGVVTEIVTPAENELGNHTCKVERVS